VAKTAQQKRREEIETWMQKHHMVPGFTNSLDSTVKILKDTYLARRRASYPNSTINKAKYPDDIWRKVGMAVIDAEADPAAYVTAIFDHYGPDMYPNMLSGNKGIAIYRSREDNAAEIKTLGLQLKLNIQQLTQRLAEKRDSLEYILHDLSNEFNPVFVYCVAMDGKMYDIAVEYKRKTEFRLNRKAYRVVYNKAFPGVIKCQ